MKFERSEIGGLFSKLRTAVPEVRAVGNDSTGILLSGPDDVYNNRVDSPVVGWMPLPPKEVVKK